MADILARLAQKAHSLSALQLTGALWYSLSNTPNPHPPHPPHSSLPQPPPPHFLDRSAAPDKVQWHFTWIDGYKNGLVSILDHLSQSLHFNALMFCSKHFILVIQA